MKDPTAEQMRRFLSDPASVIHDTDDEAQFAIEEAIYWFANNWHGGQSSNLYEALCGSPYNPGPIRVGPEDDYLYDELVERFT